MITFLAVLAVLCFFLVYGLLNYSTTQTEESYFLINRSLKSKEYAGSFAAASTSLATVLLFFVVLGVDNGLYILISPISFYLGIKFFNSKILPNLEKYKYIGNNSSPESLGTTVGNFIKERFNSKAVKSVIVFVTLLGIVSILLIELYIGINIFELFIKPEYKEYALIVIAIVAFIYTGFGGLSAVIKTDQKQYWYMLIVAITLILWLLFAQENTLEISNFFPELIPINVGLLLPWPLLLNIVFVNFFLTTSLLRNWQLTAASSTAKQVEKGLNKGLWLTVILSLCFIVFGIIYFNVFPDTPKSLNGILQSLSNSDSKVASFVLLPLFFTACLTALLSTVDSALMPILQSVFQDMGFCKKQKGSLKYFGTTLVILVITIGFYFLVFKVLKFNPINWLFTLFSVVNIAAPAIILGCIGNKKIIQTKGMIATTIIATICGLLVVFLISIFGNNIGSHWIVQLNSPIGTTATIIPIVIAYFLIKRKIQ